MWGDIALTIVASVSESMGGNWLEKKKREKFDARIKDIIEENLIEFADSSLDNFEFYELVKDWKFVAVLKNFFCAIGDGLNSSEYIEGIERYICMHCNNVDKFEVRLDYSQASRHI